MTIQVSIKNEDSRETAVISVSVENEVTGNRGASTLLKSGESTSMYVYKGNNLVIEEVSQ